MSAIARLSLRDLQNEVGEDLLERLNQLLPLVDHEFVDGDLYNSKAFLDKIFLSFGGAEKLRAIDFRTRLLNHLTSAEVGRLSSDLGLAATGVFEEDVDRIAEQGWSKESICKTLLRSFGLPEALAPRPKAVASGYSVEPGPSHRFRPLLEYQSSVFFEAMRRLQIQRSRFVIQMPTGSGKTRTAVEIIAATIQAKNCDVVWLAHSSELCMQAIDSFRSIWSHVGDREVGVAGFFGDRKVTFAEDFDGPVFTVAGFQRLQRRVEGPDPLPSFLRRERIGLVVVDEAHKVIAPTYKKITQALLGSRACCIGLTATPGRSVIDLDNNGELAAFFFERIVSFDTAGDDPISYLRKRRVLSYGEYVPLQTNLTFSLTSSEKAAAEKFLDLPAGFLRRVGADVIRNAEIVRRLIALAKEGKQIIFFACSVEHSRFICSVLSYLGVSAAHIDGTTNSELRDQFTEGFRGGEVSVLCNFEVLSTGFDAPKTDVVFIARPTSSLVLYSQMIGRGMRGPVVGGTESCLIIDVKDNIIGFSDIERTYSFFEEYWTQR